MSKIKWDVAGERRFETGVDRGVLYVSDGSWYGVGVPWNGLTKVSEKPSGAEVKSQFADNIKYLNLISAEQFGASIEAFTYPDEFGQCDGTAELVPGVLIGQQNRKKFALCYRTKIGDDIAGQDKGYKLHIIYGAQAAPSEKGYSTINDSPEAIAMSWEVTTTPVDVTDKKPTALVIIDSTKVPAAKLAALEERLYGKDAVTGGTPSPAVPAKIPTIDEIVEIFK